MQGHCNNKWDMNWNGRMGVFVPSWWSTVKVCEDSKSCKYHGFCYETLQNEGVRWGGEGI